MQDKENRISISVTPDGDFTYAPSVKHVQAGQMVIWVSTQGPFTISFKDGTPFGQLNFHSVRGEEGWFVTTREAGKGSGHFHYAVAIVAEGRVFMDAGCPEIIVNIDG